MLTKKDFVALADRLRGLDVPKPVMDELLSFCQGQNGRFNRSRFPGSLGSGLSHYVAQERLQARTICTMDGNSGQAAGREDAIRDTIQLQARGLGS